MRLGVEEWKRWATWVGFRCGAVASALLRQSRDTAKALLQSFGQPLYGPLINLLDKEKISN